MQRWHELVPNLEFATGVPSYKVHMEGPRELNEDDEEEGLAIADICGYHTT